MNGKLLLLLIFIFLFSNSFIEAQNEKFDWLKTSEGTDDEGVIDLTSDDLGNIYVVGFSRNGMKIDGKMQTCLSSNGYVYFYAKFNANSNMEWLRQFNPPTETDILCPEKIKVDKFGNIYLFGVVKGHANISAIGKSHFIDGMKDNVEYLAKYTPQGEVIWAKVFTDGFYNHERNFAIDESGNTYLLGFRANVRKISPDGKELFQTYFPNGFTPGAICIYKNKIFIITTILGDYPFTIKMANGTFINEPEIKAAEGYFCNSEDLIACLDKENGDILWVDLVRSNQSEEAKGIDVDENGNVTVLGACSNSAVFGIENKRKLEAKPEFRTVPFIAQYTENGKLNWLHDMELNDKSGGGSYPVSLKVDPKTGNIYSTRTHCNNELGWAVYVEKFDRNGSILDRKIWGIDETTNKNFGFFKSACGTANFSIDLNPITKSLYLFGESRSGYIQPKLFGDENELKYAGGTDFFICKKTFGSIVTEDPNPIDENITWTGSWTSNWGATYDIEISLNEANGIVTGSYDYHSGSIKGTVSIENNEKILKGSWMQDNNKGWFKMVLDAAGSRFKGEWGFMPISKVEGQWNGSRKR